MAKENALAFYKAMNENEELRNKLNIAVEGYAGDAKDRERAVEAILVPLAKEAGYAVTLADLLEAEKEIVGPTAELPDGELESVAGGLRSPSGYLAVTALYSCDLYEQEPWKKDSLVCCANCLHSMFFMGIGMCKNKRNVKR